jgi:hypothetical protein
MQEGPPLKHGRELLTHFIEQILLQHNVVGFMVIIQFHTFLTSWLQLSSYLGDNCCSRQEMDLQAQGMMD